MTERVERDLEPIINEARAFLDSPAPDVTAEVMRRIEALGRLSPQPSLANRLSAVLWAPRRVEFQWRHGYALAAAAALVTALVLPLPWRASVAAPPSVASSQSQAEMFVQFRLAAMDAMDVRLAGTFSDWEPRYELHETQPGLWSITLPLPAGVHDYMFIVDGQRWVPDPVAQRVDDGFGGINSRIAIVPPDTPRL